MSKQIWPKEPFFWNDGRTFCASIPFTWQLAGTAHFISARPETNWIVGGPAVELMPGFFDFVPNAKVRRTYPGILQRINPLATRTTVCCPNHCDFCGIGKRLIGPKQFRELPDWPNGCIFCDDNLLAASMGHFHRVIDRVLPHGWCDFNQGLDASLLNLQHAYRIAEVSQGKKKTAIIRLAVDSDADRPYWESAFGLLRHAGIPKHNIRAYVLCGWRGNPDADWRRCEWVESFGVYALPMWFHPLDAAEHNAVTEKQKRLGWTIPRQRALMQYYWQHRGEPFATAPASRIIRSA